LRTAAAVTVRVDQIGDNAASTLSVVTSPTGFVPNTGKACLASEPRHSASPRVRHDDRCAAM
jgi:hypothetical protein